MRDLFFSIRFLSGVAFFVLGCLVLAGGLRAFWKQSTLTESVVSKQRSADRGVLLKELEATLPGYSPVSQGMGKRYQVIADKNLFTPNRQPWRPPVPQKTAEKKTRTPLVRSGKGDVLLYGTYLAGQERRAILYFKRFVAPRSRVVTVGQTVRDKGERGKRVFYQVLKIEKDQVLVKDGAGRSLQVGLYEHGLSKTGSRPVQRKIQVTTDKTQSRIGLAGSRTKKKKVYSSGRLGFSQLRQMTTSEKERLVKEGKLRKITTPFGTAVYRPVQ